MKSYIGLYYPFIHFKDDAWIKLAALYWDKMGRIVPRGYRTSDSDTVRQLANESDLIENVYASFTSYDLNLDNTFTQLLRQHGDQLRALYSVAHRHEWPDDRQAKAEAPAGTDSKLAYIYVEKMSPDLKQSFVDNGLAVADWHVDEHGQLIEVGRVGMHPKLAAVYMTALAEEMAATYGYHPVADDALEHLAVTGCTLERLAQALLGRANIAGPALSDNEIEAHMATIDLESVLPSRIADVPTEKLITFRKEHAAERAAFQEHLEEMMTEVAGLQEIKSHEQLRVHLAALHEKYLKPQLTEYKRSLNGLAIDTVMGAFNVRVALPALVTSTVKLAGLPPLIPVVAVAGGIAFSVLPVIREKRKEARDLKRSYPVAYLMNVEEGLGTVSLTRRIAAHARQFFFGV